MSWITRWMGFSDEMVRIYSMLDPVLFIFYIKHGNLLCQPILCEPNRERPNSHERRILFVQLAAYTILRIRLFANVQVNQRPANFIFSTILFPS